MIFIPGKQVVVKSTSQPVHLQLWHELEILKFLTGGMNSAPYVNQGKFYFLDAWNANWRSAGLLYYYSFLNLAKAFLIKNGAFTSAQAQTTRVHHGLSCTPQQVSSIIDFEVKIKPSNGGQNIFAALYEKLIGQAWPFTQDIVITPKQILPYCLDISSELNTLYSINQNCEQVQSLLRTDNTNSWLEIVCSSPIAQIIQQEITGSNLTVMPAAQLSQFDKEDWLNSFRLSAAALRNYSVVKSGFFNHAQLGGQTQSMQQCNSASINNLKGYAYPQKTCDENSPGWLFCSKITLNSQAILWHPLLSNYLFSFVLSSVLRYQPYLLVETQPDFFLAEAWCRQAPISVLRDYLLFYDTIGIRIFHEG